MNFNSKFVKNQNKEKKPKKKKKLLTHSLYLGMLYIIGINMYY